MSSHVILAGIDEAGRGPLAGPVVAAACVLPFRLTRRRIRGKFWSPFKRSLRDECVIADSKALSAAQRERAFAWITAHCAYGIGIVEHARIDADGIRAATHTAMCDALHRLRRTVEPTLLLIDGRDRFRFALPSRDIVRGDVTEPAIAAASILAKVTRDRIMTRSAFVFRGFSFDVHKGYGTRQHREELFQLGPSPIHRRTFGCVASFE